jgi:hypothetical protein
MTSDDEYDSDEKRGMGDVTLGMDLHNVNNR